ncbi:MAG: hemerythrin domain-containing protein [Candidatus Accumulibacter sp.]|uniref:Hemerythrin domain-containing protein n=1 Tax=Candidatus Accumulibacter affinis TaxID=2954384 RepID=A0A935TGY9_9PROT|nr:hemerythrin domain-containing protein [Candidatus Accumulibacter affinis]
MKRHSELLTLSREHHAALKLARDARRAAESGDASELGNLAQRVVSFFAAELDPHFRIEEQHLLVFLAHAGERELVQRTLTEHAELRRIASTMCCPDRAMLLRFADLLAEHVRFEERELFEVAQARLDGNPIQI